MPSRSRSAATPSESSSTARPPRSRRSSSRRGGAPGAVAGASCGRAVAARRYHSRRPVRRRRRHMTELAADVRAIDPAAPQYNATLVRREDQHESLARFWVRFDGEPTPFVSGQYMTIGVFADGKLVQRPYSVASDPAVAGDEGYEMYVRLVNGGTFTPLLWRLPVGHRMRMIGPKGKFTLLPDDDRTHIFISSGTGNAPFVSMMRALLREGRPRRTVFLNGVSYARDLGYDSIVR